MQRFSFALIAALSLCLISCGNDSNSATQTAASASGNWQMSLEKTGAKTASKQLSGFLLDNSQGVLTGSMIVIDYPCSGVGAANGAITQSSISLTVNPTGLTINLQGTLGSGSSSMSGSYTILSSGCTGTHTQPEGGSWKADLVQPFTGNIRGTFTSTKFGTTFPISGSITQGQNNGGTYAALTGSLDISGSSCFTSASISGEISGTSVLINFGSSDGTQIGQVSGTSSLDGSSLTGRYTILPQNSAPGTPCREGDVGSVSFTL